MKKQRQLTLHGAFAPSSALKPVYKQPQYPIHKFENAYVCTEHKQRPAATIKQLRHEACTLFKEAKAEENYSKYLKLRKNADPGILEVEDARKRLAEIKSADR